MSNLRPEELQKRLLDDKEINIFIYYVKDDGCVIYERTMSHYKRCWRYYKNAIKQRCDTIRKYGYFPIVSFSTISNANY